jgi:MFS family permease
VSWSNLGDYSGSFLSLALIYLFLIILLSFLSDLQVKVEFVAGEERPLRSLFLQPTFAVALLSGVVSYGVMSFIMTATPISMHNIDGHTLSETGSVIQSHVMAMYLPSLFTGYILSRWSAPKVMLTGVVLMFACVLLSIPDHGLPYYWSALVLLGLGWNFLFVGGTVLLTRSYRPSERFKAQAVNDFMVFGVQALASLSAGSVIFRTNWTTLNLLNLPVLLAMFIAIIIVLRVSEGQTIRLPSPGG